MMNWQPAGSRRLNVCVVGAGNLGHVLIGQLGARGDVNVTCFSRKCAGREFQENATQRGIVVKQQSPREGVADVFVTGKATAVSARASDVLPAADLVIITVPSHAREAVLRQIAPHLSRDKPVFVGAFPGMGGFDWIAKSVFKEHKLDNAVVWACKDVPFMAAWTKPGKSVTNLGPKKALYLAVGGPTLASSNECKKLQAVLQELCGIPTVVLNSFMNITLTPGNPIMHPSIMYGMFGPKSQWDGKPLKEQPLFYEAVSELSSYFLSRADGEVQAIRRAIYQQTGTDMVAVWPLNDNIKKVYGELVTDNRTLMRTMQTNRAYATIRTPMLPVAGGGFTIKLQHRFFLEDVPFGLVILRDVADLVGVATPMIDELLMWCQSLMHKEYLVDGRLKGRHMRETGAPSVYGVVSIHDVVASSPSPTAKL